MEIVESTLPWNEKPVRVTAGLREFVGDIIGREALRYLPAEMCVYSDIGVSDRIVIAFCREMAEFLCAELDARAARRRRFCELSVISDEEIEYTLTINTHLQPWAIYYSVAGGLNLDDFVSSHSRGVIPCSSMKNHGVAWRVSADGMIRSWLATARKEGLGWEWESDIGHESGHAAFAPVPLYMQEAQEIAAAASLSDAKSIDDLQPQHVAKIGYMLSELGVIAVRGERRATETGLPVAGEREEVVAFLKWMEVLYPGAGFRMALDLYERSSGVVDVDRGREIFLIGAPILRILPYASRLAIEREIPTVERLRGVWVRNLSRSCAGVMEAVL